MTNQTPRPISESYWVEPGSLLAGEYPGHFDEEQTRKRMESLLESGFDMFIDLTQPNEIEPYLPGLLGQAKVHEIEVKYHNFPIGDFGLPTPEQMRAILDTIDEGLRSDHKIYLHCWGGIGRTGTTVGCYLVRQGKTGDEALSQLAEWWRSVPKSQYHLHSPETQKQVEFIRNWAEHDPKSQKTNK